MNAKQVEEFIRAGGTVNRFTKINSAARKWLKEAFERGEICRRTDGFPNARYQYYK
jgi:hypothetical protein